MSQKENLSIDRLLELWIIKFGEKKRSDSGNEYKIIHPHNRMGNLLTLVGIFVEHGHSEEEIRTGIVSTKVVKTCWSDLIKKMTPKEVKEAREKTRRQWEAAIDEFYIDNFRLPEYKRSEPIKKLESVKKAEPLPDLNPEDRISFRSEDSEEVPFDDEILKELAALDDIGKNE